MDESVWSTRDYDWDSLINQDPGTEYDKEPHTFVPMMLEPLLCRYCGYDRLREWHR